MRTRVGNILSQAIAVGLTSDGWTDLKMRKFVAITAHFLTQEFIPRRVLISVTSMDGAATAERLLEFFKSEAACLPAQCLIPTMVTDNGSNFLKASRLFIGGEVITCFAHNLQLVVKDTLTGEFDAALDPIRQLVARIKKSTNLTSELEKIQREQGVSCPLRLKADVPTRWNSTFILSVQ